MNFQLLSSFLLLIATTQAGVILKKNGFPWELVKRIGNVVNLDADARVNVLGNEVGIDGAIGVGEQGIGAHASADADVLGQKAKVHADVLDGHEVDQHNHEVLRDSLNRQYVLQRQYIGSQSVLVRKYLDNGQIYVDGANSDNVLQHQQVDESRMYDSQGGWWDIKTRRYYNPLGQWISTRVWDPRLLTMDVKMIYDKEGGWWDRNTGKYYNRLGQWISGKVYEDSQYPNQMQNKYIIRQGRIYDVTGGWWDLDGKYYNPSGQWLRGRYWDQELWKLAQSLGGKQQWNQHLWEQQQLNQQHQGHWNQQQQQKYTIRQGRIYDVTGGWWDLDGKYYNPSGQWLSGRYWDQELWKLAQSLGGKQQWNQHLWEQQQQHQGHWNQQQQQKYIIREGRIYDVTGGWWDLDGKYYNPSGQWLSGRYWNQELWKLAQSQGGKQQWNQHLWEQQQQHQGHWNQQQQQKYIIREGRIYDVTGGWWDLDGKYYNPSGQWLSGRYWDQELWKLAQSLGGKQQWNQHLWEQQQQHHGHWNQQQQQKYIIREGRIYDVTGGWWDLDGKYYNPSGQWLSGRYWDQELWKLAQSLGGKQQWNQHLWEQQQQHQGHWNQQQQQKYIIREGRIYDLTGGWWDLDGKYYNPSGQWLRGRYWDQELWKLVQSLGGKQKWNQQLWEQQQQWNKQHKGHWNQQQQQGNQHDDQEQDEQQDQRQRQQWDQQQQQNQEQDQQKQKNQQQLEQWEQQQQQILVDKPLVNLQKNATVNIVPVPVVSSIPLATSYDRDATLVIRPQDDDRLDTLFVKRNLESIDGSMRNIDSAVNLPLLQQNDVLMNKDSTVHVANNEGQVVPVVSSLPLATSYDRDATLVMRPQDDERLDTLFVKRNLESIDGSMRKIDSAVNLPLLPQNDVLMNKDSTVHVANLHSVPLSATSRDRDASVNIPLLPQNDVLMNKDSTVHVANNEGQVVPVVSSLPLGTSYDRDATLVMRPQDDDRLDTLFVKRNLERIDGFIRNIDSTVNRPHLPQNDVLMNEDSTVHIANLHSVPLTSHDAPKNVDSTDVKGLEMQVRPEEDERLDSLPEMKKILLSTVSKDPRGRMQQLVTSTGWRDSDGTIRMDMGENGKGLKLENVNEENMNMQVRPEEDEILDSLPEMKKRVLVTVSKEPRGRMQQLVTSTGSDGTIRMDMGENGKALKLENVNEENLIMQGRPEEDEILDSLPEMKKRVLVTVSKEPRGRMQQLVTSTGSDGNIRMDMGQNALPFKLENINAEIIEEPSNGRWVVTRTHVTSQNKPTLNKAMMMQTHSHADHQMLRQHQKPQNPELHQPRKNHQRINA